MGPTNQSAVSKNSKAYKKSKRKFRKNALAMDYTEEEGKEEEIDKKVNKVSQEIRKKKNG